MSDKDLDRHLERVLDADGEGALIQCMEIWTFEKDQIDTISKQKNSGPRLVHRNGSAFTIFTHEQVTNSEAQAKAREFRFRDYVDLGYALAYLRLYDLAVGVGVGS